MLPEPAADRVNAVPQVLPHEAKACQSAEAESPDPTVDPSTHWQHHQVRVCLPLHSPCPLVEMAIIQLDAAGGTSAVKSLRVTADSGWPTDTMRSEDIGARRELVSRSEWRGEWGAAEGGEMLTRWVKHGIALTLPC